MGNLETLVDTVKTSAIAPFSASPAALTTSGRLVPPISPSEFNACLGSARAPLVLDVRREAKFVTSQRMPAAAIRCAPEDLVQFALQHAPRDVVVSCVYGHNVSADAVEQLAAAGWNARALSGGLEGGQDAEDHATDITRWRAQPALSICKRPDWGVTGETGSRWITRERPKIDRVACPWLIRRFIDPRAQFFYVPTAQVFVEAARLHAVAYDIPGAPVSHDGERCSFDALLTGFDLRDAALELLAAIVRGADTDRLDLAAQSAGLLALSVGLSRLHSEDDAAMLDAAMPMYDALYAWCRVQTQGAPEPHNWRPETMVAQHPTQRSGAPE